MTDRLPLSALLSQALTAFIIEFDNEFEHRTPHRTTNHASGNASGQAPWLVSMVIWSKFMRFVPDGGVTIREFKRQSGLTKEELKMWLTRLASWWGYIAIDKNASQDRSDWLIQPSPGGQKALKVWRPLAATIEKRWEERFGQPAIDELRQSLQALLIHLDGQLPDSLPILGYALLTAGPDPESGARTKSEAGSLAGRALPALLSKALLAFAIEFERESRLSLAMTANVLRLLGEEGTPIRDLPRRSGVSKEAIAVAVKRLETAGLVAFVSDEQKQRGAKALRLTAEGGRARDTYYRLAATIEDRWESKCDGVVKLRSLLERLACKSSAGRSSLFDGLEPHPDNWRASIPEKEVLPHYPMCLHRGGFPDGS